MTNIFPAASFFKHWRSWFTQAAARPALTLTPDLKRNSPPMRGRSMDGATTRRYRFRRHAPCYRGLTSVCYHEIDPSMCTGIVVLSVPPPSAPTRRKRSASQLVWPCFSDWPCAAEAAGKISLPGRRVLLSNAAPRPRRRYRGTTSSNVAIHPLQPNIQTKPMQMLLCLSVLTTMYMFCSNKKEMVPIAESFVLSDYYLWQNK